MNGRGETEKIKWNENAFWIMTLEEQPKSLEFIYFTDDIKVQNILTLWWKWLWLLLINI